MQVAKFDLSSKLLGTICIGAIALVSSTVFAIPNGGGGANPDDSGGGSSPRERLPRPPRKPQIPGYVLFDGAYYRETTLPLCEWGSGERSFFDQFIRQDGEQTSHWTCLGGNTPSFDPHTGYRNDTCSFSGPPGSRPVDATYRLAPFDYWENWYADLEWPNGTAAYGAWSIECTRNPSSTAAIDTVVRSVFEGTWNADTGCPPWPNQGRRSTLIAELVGGDVEHVRPAIVRAQANIGYFDGHGNARNLPGDLVLAIQVFGSTGWEDVKMLAYTTGIQPSLYELEATVPDGSFVRVQVRGTEKCLGGSMGDGYDIRSLRIQVETCIPDQSNPGSCL